MNEEEIYLTLADVASTEGLSFSEGLLRGLAKSIHAATNESSRPLPDFATVISSEGFRGCFYEILEHAKSQLPDTQVKIDLLGEAKAQLSPEEDVDWRTIRRGLRFKVNDSAIWTHLMTAKSQSGLTEKMSEVILKLESSQETYNIPPDILTFGHKSNLTTQTLLAYGVISTQEIQSESEPAHFTHFYPYDSQPRSSEYLSTYDSEDESMSASFVKTNHGIGSAVYGLSDLVSGGDIQHQINKASHFQFVEVSKPLYMDATQSEAYTEVSKWMQRTADAVRDKQRELRLETHGTKITRSAAFDAYLGMPGVQDAFAANSTKLASITNLGIDEEAAGQVLKDSIADFMESARHTKGPLVEMPINFVIQRYDFTGVISQYNDTFSRGLIALPSNSYTADWDRMGIKPMVGEAVVVRSDDALVSDMQTEMPVSIPYDIENPGLGIENVSSGNPVDMFYRMRDMHTELRESSPSMGEGTSLKRGAEETLDEVARVRKKPKKESPDVQTALRNASREHRDSQPSSEVSTRVVTENTYTFKS
jgi:hypothetical protein